MNNQFIRLLLPTLLIGFFGGCASGVKHHDDPAKREAYFAKGGKIASEVSLSLSKEAQALLSDNLRFDQEKLLVTIKRALGAKNLLAKTPDPTLPRIEILVTDIRVRGNITAGLFGFMAGDDRVVGDVIALDPSGKELQRFSVSASYALGGIAGAQDETRLGWLYETFAQHTVEALTGGKKD
jgi:hypothetical protein